MARRWRTLKRSAWRPTRLALAAAAGLIVLGLAGGWGAGRRGPAGADRLPQGGARRDRGPRAAGRAARPAGAARAADAGLPRADRRRGARHRRRLDRRSGWRGDLPAAERLQALGGAG